MIRNSMCLCSSITQARLALCRDRSGVRLAKQAQGICSKISRPSSALSDVTNPPSHLDEYSNTARPLSTEQDHLYSLHFYSFLPKDYSNGVEIFTENSHFLRNDKNRCVGSWTSEFGSLNNFVQIWKGNGSDLQDTRKDFANKIGHQEGLVASGLHLLQRCDMIPLYSFRWWPVQEHLDTLENTPGKVLLVIGYAKLILRFMTGGGQGFPRHEVSDNKKLVRRRFADPFTALSIRLVLTCNLTY